MKPVKWGIISTAKIGVDQVIPAMMESPDCDIVAIASRDLSKAQAAAKKLGIAKSYGSYEELFADPEIEAVYNPLPNNFHVDVSIQALEAGKHVLCEKPISMDADEAMKLIDARDKAGKEIAEAFMVRHHPQWQYARELVRSGEIGDLKAMQCAFSYDFPDVGPNYRSKQEMGGGGIYDIGVYPIVMARYLFNAEPKRVIGLTENDPRFDIDRIASVLIEFEQGHLNFICATQMVDYQRFHVFGTKKRIEVAIPFNTPPNRPVDVYVDDGSELGDLSAVTKTFETADKFRLQGEAFSRYVRGVEKNEFPIEDAVKNMKVVDAIFTSIRENRWVSL